MLRNNSHEYYHSLIVRMGSSVLHGGEAQARNMSPLSPFARANIWERTRTPWAYKRTTKKRPRPLHTKAKTKMSGAPEFKKAHKYTHIQFIYIIIVPNII